MTHRDLIDRLGKGTKVAAWLTEQSGETVDREAVYKWRVNDVPLRWRPLVARMAKENRIPLPKDFMAWVEA